MKQVTKKIILSVLALVCVTLTWAIVEKTEIMTVIKTDGTKVEYKVNDVDQVTFAGVEESYKMLVAPAKGEEVKLDAIPAVFRAEPESDGAPYNFGISMVNAAEPAEARAGQYAIQIAVSQTKINTADVDLANGAESGVTVSLYSYKDGEVDNVWEAQKSGSLATAVNNKTKQVTIALEAAFEDGTRVVVDYQGSVIAADNLKGLNPPFEYKNQGQYFNADGMPGGLFDVLDMKHTPAISYRGVSGDRFDFTLSNGNTCWFILDSKYFGQTFDFATAAAGECYFYYDNIQLVSKGTPYMNQGTEGTINVVMNEDGSYTFDLKVTNKYIPSFSSSVSGTPEYVILNYTSAAPEPEPEPEPIVVENQLVYVGTNGLPADTLNIVEVKHETDKAIPYNSSAMGDRYDFIFSEDNAPTCYIIIKPEFVGKTFDLATAEAQSYYIKYGATEIAASGLSWLSGKIGQEGTVNIIENEDGSWSIDFDITLKTDGNPDTKERVVINYTIAAPEPEPEPVVTVDPNTCLYVQASGSERTFTVESCNAETSKSFNGLSFDLYNITLSGDMQCKVYIAADQYGKKIDFASAPDNSYFVQFGFSYSNLIDLGAKNTKRPGSYNEGKKGSLCVTKDEDGIVTIDLDVTNSFVSGYGYDGGDGSHVVLNYTQPKPEPEPEPIAANTGNWTNTSGTTRDFTVTGCTAKEAQKYNGLTFDLYTLSLSNDMVCKVYIAADQYGKTIDFATAPANSYWVEFGFDYSNLIALGAPNTARPGSYAEGNKGTLTATKNSDGSVTIDLDATNSYVRGGFAGGDPNHVVLNYTPEVVEPEPVVTVEPNTCLYVQASGTERTFTVESCDAQTSKSYNGLTFDAYSLTLSGDMLCTVYIAADQYNNKIDFANAPDNSYFVTFGFSYSNLIQLGANNTKRPGSYNVGDKGSLCVSKDEDGIVTIDLDVTNSFTSAYGYDNGDGSHVVLNYTQPKPEPEPALPNEGQRFDADGNPSGTFTVESMKYTAGVNYRGVAGDRFDFTLSNGVQCYVILDTKYFGQTFDFATAEAGECYFVYDNIQIASKGTQFMNQGTTGTINVNKNNDGTFVIDFDVTNKYLASWGGEGGTPERVVLHFAGAAQ